MIENRKTKFKCIDAQWLKCGEAGRGCKKYPPLLPTPTAPIDIALLVGLGGNR